MTLSRVVVMASAIALSALFLTGCSTYAESSDQLIKAQSAEIVQRGFTEVQFVSRRDYTSQNRYYASYGDCRVTVLVSDMGVIYLSIPSSKYEGEERGFIDPTSALLDTVVDLEYCNASG